MDGSLVPFGRPRPERADAVRNRLHLLDTVRAMIAEVGVEKVTMDGLAERACLGKGTVFRRFGTRAGIFAALMDDDDRAFQQRVLSGPPPLGPGADPFERLIAYGRARIAFLLGHAAIARASLDPGQPMPVGDASVSRVHIRVLLGQAELDVDDLDTLAVQLTAALEGPILLYMSMPSLEGETDADEVIRRLATCWQTIVERLFRR